MHLQNNLPDDETAAVSVSMPVDVVGERPESTIAVEDKPAEMVVEEKIIEVLQVDEAAIEAELEEIKRNAAAMQKISHQSKPQLLFDPVDDDDIPTLSHQHLNKKPATKEINETVANTTSSLNDKLKVNVLDLSAALNDTPVRDLKKAIGVNDRYVFISQLFRGDEVMYERSIKTINGFRILPEAEYWMERELKVKLGWDENREATKHFYQLVRRRFA